MKAEDDINRVSAAVKRKLELCETVRVKLAGRRILKYYHGYNGLSENSITKTN